MQKSLLKYACESENYKRLYIYISTAISYRCYGNYTVYMYIVLLFALHVVLH